MAALTKRRKQISEKVDFNKIYSAEEAFQLLKDTSLAKFTESVDVAIKLGIDSKKTDQVVRGATVLPKGTGKTVRVAVFAQGDNAKLAKEAGADIVGFEDLAEQVKKGEINFDVVIATPAAMRVVGQLGQILGPRGLMPNPKVGTVSNDVATAVNQAKSGQVRYRTDKAGILHCRIGSVKFSASDLLVNLQALVADVKKSRPAAAKGAYLRKVVVSTTMGPGLQLDVKPLEA